MRCNGHGFALVLLVILTPVLSAAAEGIPKSSPTRTIDLRPGEESFFECGSRLLYFPDLDSLFLFGNDGTTGCEVWISDATVEGTTLLKDICAGPTGSRPLFATYFDGAVYFFASPAGTYIRELWKSDGTPEGTISIATFSDSVLNSRVSPFAPLGNRLLFKVDDGIHGLEWWCTDGTPEGTRIVKDINPNGDAFGESTYALDVAVLHDVLYFGARTDDAGYELWRTDGSEEGTYLVKDIVPGPTGSVGGYFYATDEVIYFQAEVEPWHEELFMSDGTESGTGLVKRINDSTISPFLKGSSPSKFFEFEDVVYFEALHNSIGSELWRTDGSEEGTWLVKDINPSPYTFLAGSSRPSGFQVYNNQLLFVATDGINGTQVWTTNGEASGTLSLAGDNKVSDSVPIEVNGFLYYAGNVLRRVTPSLNVEAPWPGISGPFSGFFYYHGYLLTIERYFNTGSELKAINLPPWVESIDPETAGPTDATEVSFIARFNEPVQFVNKYLFLAFGEGIHNPFVAGVEELGDGRDWRVRVNTGVGDGVLYLRLIDDDTITEEATYYPLEGYGQPDGSFTSESGIFIDKDAPTVVIATTAPNPTLDAPIPVQVTFERPVTGVSAQDFLIGNATLDNFTGSGADYSFELTPLDFGEVTAWVPPNICVDEGQIPNAPSNVLVVQFQAPPEFHTADTTQDRLINLSELLRVVQFFNAHLVTGNPEGMFYCDPEEKEDGYLLLPAGAHQDCAPHASDYKPQDWRINLSELLRVIQFFNSAGYHWCFDAAKEGDGYCVGPGEG